VDDRSLHPETLAGDPFAHAAEARQSEIAAACERAQFAEEEAFYAERDGDVDAAEYWRQVPCPTVQAVREVQR